MNRATKPILALATFLSLGTLGLTFAFVGASLPELLFQFGITIGEASLVPATVQVSYAVLCFLGGILADFLSKRRILVLGCLATALGAGIVGMVEPFWANLMIFALIGIGGGTVFISSNLLVIDLFPENPGSFLNIHHLVFAICSFGAPILMSYSITSGAGWQAAFRGLSVASAALALVLLLNRYPLSPPPRPKGGNPWKSRIEAVATKNAGFVILLTFLAIGTQFTIMFLLVTFLVDTRGFSVPAASATLSAFYILLAGGRLVCSVLVRKYSNRLILLVLLSLLGVSVLGALLGSPTLSAISLAVSGLASSGLYPSILAMASQVTHSTSRGTVLGTLAMAGGIGGMTIIQISARISEGYGITAGFWALWAVVILTFVYLFFGGRSISRVKH